MTADATATERQRRRRARQAAGLVQVTLETRPEFVAELEATNARLLADRIAAAPRQPGRRKKGDKANVAD